MKYAVKLKKLKRRSIKTKRQLVEHKTITDINFNTRETFLLLVCFETASLVERNKIKKSGKVEKLNEVFIKQIYSKS